MKNITPLTYEIPTEPDENIPIPRHEIEMLRKVSAFDLQMIISETHFRGWHMGRDLLYLAYEHHISKQPVTHN